MNQEENTPLDSEEVVNTQRLKEEKKSRKQIAYLLELIPLSLLMLAYFLKYLEMPIWWWFFSLGAVMACLNYLFLSWFFFRPKDYDVMQWGVTVAFAACFALGILSILFRLQSWAAGRELYILALAGTCLLFVLSGLMLLVNIRRAKESNFYRISLARLMILLAILLRVMG